LNHTIVFARDNRVSAEFLAHILGLEAGTEWGPFIPLELSNGVTLVFATVDHEICLQHYAFLVTEEEFDGIFQRIQDMGIAYYADPHGKQSGEINHNDGGRGLYFMDPAGHSMEAITRPYGSGENLRGRADRRGGPKDWSFPAPFPAPRTPPVCRVAKGPGRQRAALRLLQRRLEQSHTHGAGTARSR
jgi:extradiol dioxygenase family protein